MDLSSLNPLPPSAQVQLAQMQSDQSLVGSLAGAAGANSPFSTPSATVDLSPLAQQIVGGQMPAMQVTQLEQIYGVQGADGTAPTLPATTTTTTTSFDPADPFGVGLGAGGTVAATGTTPFDPANPWGPGQ